ncbi:hypothetical protein BC792_10354 [Sphingobacterium allocomposti]|uniref:Uncharacterized protein n=1 Tax=Sphingobacterium allocomposti TaxID=415956 RepID=A0A5S5DP33_9SPHI|nr:hypothetical protein [Sphingobacterium composti Yoo et al. 2007 non Ten et al. 2007]TYP97128.1 hypothetical protein BC792_10354 [Sphingobacterium composti Yoo et al. 2007 non Ten et al. 2007]
MVWNNPDAYPGETEEEYEVRKTGESQAATGLMSGIIKFLLFVLKVGAIFHAISLFKPPDSYADLHLARSRISSFNGFHYGC